MLVGVVGKANVGKSTFFKALTLADVLIANYPFATIEPNKGVASVKIDCADKFFNVQCNPRVGYCARHKRFVPVEVMDVAGLVPGAYEGKGMGNQFLDDLRQAHVLIHIVDISGSTNEKGEPVETGTYDPAEDIRFLETELDMWYLGILKKVWEKMTKTSKQENVQPYKAFAKQFSGLGANEDMIKGMISKLNLNQDDATKWSEAEIKKFTIELRKKTKPMLIAANKIDVPGASENLKRVKELFKDRIIIPCSAESELALREAAKHKLIDYLPGDSDFNIIDDAKLSEKQKNALNFIRENVLKKYNGTGAQQIINAAVFDLLKYVAIFPGGVNKLSDSEGRVLPDCFLMPSGTTALDFAYKLHTDFGKYFIRAIDVKKKMPIGKDHALNSGDVVEIVSGK